MGIITPTVKAEIIKIQSRLENLNKFWTIYAKSKETMTTTICATSMPRANSKSGNSLSVGFPERMLLK